MSRQKEKLLAQINKRIMKAQKMNEQDKIDAFNKAQAATNNNSLNISNRAEYMGAFDTIGNGILETQNNFLRL